MENLFDAPTETYPADDGETDKQTR
nr:MAG: hypothetical protein [Bacteriophage sp.]